MIYLVDTNVVIDALDNKSLHYNEMERLFKENDIILCGVVRAELLHGAHSQKNNRELHGYLSAFRNLNIEGSDWETLGDQLYMYRTNGITVPFPDAMIASLGIKYGIPVWTDDKHFSMMQSVIPQLKVVRTEELIKG